MYCGQDRTGVDYKSQAPKTLSKQSQTESLSLQVCGDWFRDGL